MQLGYLFDRSIELCMQANPSIYAVSGSSSGIGYGVNGGAKVSHLAGGLKVYHCN